MTVPFVEQAYLGTDAHHALDLLAADEARVVVEVGLEGTAITDGSMGTRGVEHVEGGAVADLTVSLGVTLALLTHF